jgi:RimJ/RimL family protein N-acetyltransferase
VGAESRARVQAVDLVAIDRAGRFAAELGALPEMAAANCEVLAAYYGTVGFEPPWISYLAVVDGQVVGGGAFKGAPRDGRVEIAYYTVPEHEGRGVATATARALVRVAREARPDVIVAAQTLRVPGASTALLRKLGFVLHAALEHPEDGEVWEWRLQPERR